MLKFFYFTELKHTVIISSSKAEFLSTDCSEYIDTLNQIYHKWYMIYKYLFKV